MSTSRSLEDSFGAIRHWEGLPEVPQYCRYDDAIHRAASAEMKRAYGGVAEHANMHAHPLASEGIRGDAPIGKYEGYLKFDRPLLSKEVKDYWSKALYDMISEKSYKSLWLKDCVKVKPKKNRLLLLL